MDRPPGCINIRRRWQGAQCGTVLVVGLVVRLPRGIDAPRVKLIIKTETFTVFGFDNRRSGRCGLDELESRAMVLPARCKEVDDGTVRDIHVHVNASGYWVCNSASRDTAADWQ